MIRYKRELIESYIAENKISKTEFCKRCNIGMRILNKFLDNAPKMKVLPLIKISKLLNVKYIDLFEVE